jgi:hypothetical protein
MSAYTRNAVELKVLGEPRTFRLRLVELDRLQEDSGADLFDLPDMVSGKDPKALARVAPHLFRLGLIGGGMHRSSAEPLAGRMVEEMPFAQIRACATVILAAALEGVSPDEEAPGKLRGALRRAASIWQTLTRSMRT